MGSTKADEKAVRLASHRLAFAGLLRARDAPPSTGARVHGPAQSGSRQASASSRSSVLGAELCSTLTTRHVHFAQDYFLPRFWVHGNIERKAPRLPVDPCPHGGLPATDTPPGAALVADPHGRVVVTQSPERARGRPSRGFGQTWDSTHLPFRLPRGVLAALPSRAHSFVSVPCAGPGRVAAHRQVGFRGKVTAVCNRSGSLTVSPRVNMEIPRGTACPLLGPRRKALMAALEDGWSDTRCLWLRFTTATCAPTDVRVGEVALPHHGILFRHKKPSSAHTHRHVDGPQRCARRKGVGALVRAGGRGPGGPLAGCGASGWQDKAFWGPRASRGRTVV
ncbi:uncharacterized protein LOC121022850 isoform X2 [Herpailurus yagouaroundi]|uniref:uncharacterized protein LOC121022850 isoform X2 n=1 Tax=Herpailurus yagouaroundi TaxID=1608482 RepID=UPI001AD6AD5E|nr:uncharacterized protein LOC121022850 isoform X2 [Puma yagouaroundi]XP_040320305.1 uncharacterized protein LOC121022850 isoform X2 [Puma yagouaroundi]XP_040320306.1 uncharacterized protein LOC121022850 isoform X2 [Puma yagouaroundi]